MVKLFFLSVAAFFGSILLLPIAQAQKDSIRFKSDKLLSPQMKLKPCQ